MTETSIRAYQGEHGFRDLTEIQPKFEFEFCQMASRHRFLNQTKTVPWKMWEFFLNP